MTNYIVWCPDQGQQQEDGIAIDAYSYRTACEKWAYRNDSDSADHLIVRGHDAELMIVEAGSDVAPLRYSVSGESVPTYNAVLME